MLYISHRGDNKARVQKRMLYFVRALKQRYHDTYKMKRRKSRSRYLDEKTIDKSAEESQEA